MEELHTGDTLVVAKTQKPLASPHYPVPMVARAVEPKTRGDEGEISEGLRRLAEADPTFQVEMNPQTKELVIAGIGEQHIGLVLNRLRRRGIHVTTKLPKIAYRETITGKPMYGIVTRNKRVGLDSLLNVPFGLNRMNVGQGMSLSIKFLGV